MRSVLRRRLTESYFSTICTAGVRNSTVRDSTLPNSIPRNSIPRNSIHRDSMHRDSEVCSSEPRCTRVGQWLPLDSTATAAIGLPLLILCLALFFFPCGSAAQINDLILLEGRLSTSRPLMDTDVLAIALPPSAVWRHVEVLLVSDGIEVSLTTADVDGQERHLRFSDQELFGPDPGRFSGGELLVRITESGQQAIPHRMASAVDPAPWYPHGATPQDVLERAARKLKEGLTKKAAEDLLTLRDTALVPALSSERMRLNASVQQAYSDVSSIHGRTAEQLLESAVLRAPAGSSTREKVLIDQAAQNIRKATFSSDRETWRSELTEALSRARLALSSARELDHRDNAAAALLEIAAAASWRGWALETRAATEAALDLAGDPDTRWRCALALARSHMVTGKLSEAVTEAREALSIVEQIRGSRHDDAAAMGLRRQPAILLADIESRRGDALSSLIAAEKIRVRSSGATPIDRAALEKLARDAQGLATVVVALDAGTVLLVWSTVGGEWQHRRIDQRRGEAIERGMALHHSRGANVEAADWLSKRLFPAALNPCDRLLLAPIGGLRRIPWGILTIDGEALVDRCSWSLLPGLGSGPRALEPLPREGWWTVVDPWVPDRSRLPGSRAEGERIQDRFPAVELRSGEAATVAAVEQAATVAKVLHIACHGDFQPYDPGGSNLRLSPAGESDGVLTADQLSRMELIDCRLLALTGCETALGSASGADDLAGFPRAALEAGCQAILGTLWPVEDASAGRFLGSLVAATDGQVEPAEVLRRACRARRGDPRDRDPGAWSGWVLVENGW